VVGILGVHLVKISDGRQVHFGVLISGFWQTYFTFGSGHKKWSMNPPWPMVFPTVGFKNDCGFTSETLAGLCLLIHFPFKEIFLFGERLGVWLFRFFHEYFGGHFEFDKVSFIIQDLEN
jgi:hypothetical protein